METIYSGLGHLLEGPTASLLETLELKLCLLQMQCKSQYRLDGIGVSVSGVMVKPASNSTTTTRANRYNPLTCKSR